MDRGGWRATVHRVAKSWTKLKQLSMNECTLKIDFHPQVRANCRYAGSCGVPWLSAFITVAASSHHGCIAVEAGIGHQAGGVQVPSWRGSLQMSLVVQVSDSRQG